MSRRPRRGKTSRSSLSPEGSPQNLHHGCTYSERHYHPYYYNLPWTKLIRKFYGEAATKRFNLRDY